MASEGLVWLHILRRRRLSPETRALILGYTLPSKVLCGWQVLCPDVWFRRTDLSHSTLREVLSKTSDSAFSLIVHHYISEAMRFVAKMRNGNKDDFNNGSVEFCFILSTMACVCELIGERGSMDMVKHMLGPLREWSRQTFSRGDRFESYQSRSCIATGLPVGLNAMARTVHGDQIRWPNEVFTRRTAQCLRAEAGD